MTHGLNRIMWSTLGIVLAALWGLPFVYSVWTAFHDEVYSANFVWNAPLTISNFFEAWKAICFVFHEHFPHDHDRSYRKPYSLHTSGLCFRSVQI